MQCPKCESLITRNTGVCDQCGTEFFAKRVRMDSTGKEFVLTGGEDDDEPIQDSSGTDEWRFPARPHAHDAPPTSLSSDGAETVRSGGFLRRACALLFDCAVILVLSALMLWLSSIGYKVGLSAHARTFTMNNASALFVIVSLGWLALSAAYFVIFHGMDGKTPGKTLLGLRVIDERESSISYGRAFLRWLATVGFAPIALGFLWVLTNREKRAWHDLLARTRVIRG
jgi:uncharacterized RDD family membrane protein YckC